MVAHITYASWVPLHVYPPTSMTAALVSPKNTGPGSCSTRPRMGSGPGAMDTTPRGGMIMGDGWPGPPAGARC